MASSETPLLLKPVIMSCEAVIPVAFRPLLVQACAYLGLPPPLYACCDEAVNDYSVIVELNHEPNAYRINGGPGKTGDESSERAARKMLIHLMNIRGLCVYDVNLARRDKAERCLALFMLKRKHYKDTEKGRPTLPTGSSIPGERIHPANDCVRVDFYAILGSIVERFNIHVTCIEYLQLDVYDHVAWLIVACPGKYCDSEVIVSSQCASQYAAKQSVAERAIQFLMPIYNFLVEDANFHFLQQTTLSLKLERETYFAMKDRIYGVVHDLKTVDGYECATFQEAALKRGLIEQCDANERCLNEAVEVQMPRALRQLFVTILLFNQPADPKALWDKYYPFLSEDFRHAYPGNENKISRETGSCVQKILEGMGRTLAEFNLGDLHCSQTETTRVIRDIEDVLDAPIPEECAQARKQLNAGQKAAYKSIIRCLKDNKPGIFFIDGPGGTGKTYLYGALYAKARLLKKIVLPTASSGIAAANLPNGRTAHSRFKLPLDHAISVTCDVPKQGALASLLKEAALIIWDEAPMANKASIHALDLLLRDLADPDIPFGGKVVVLGGDFRQVLPVVPRQTQHEAVEASLVSSHLWPYFTRFSLHENMRAREDPSFASFLLALGNGELQDSESGLVKLPDDIVIPFDENGDPMEMLLHTVYPEIKTSPFDTSVFNDRAILTPKNDEVDSINSFFISQFHGEEMVYRGFDTIIDDSCNIYPQEFLHTLCPGGMSPHKLALKIGCPVILLRNIDPANGLCNGTRLTCKRFFPNLILCEIAVGSCKGQEVLLPRVNLRPSSSSQYPFQFQRKQFPIKLSFAMTINKAQGQTLNEVGIYLRQPCFSHGQLYVALSRARRACKVKVIVKQTAQHVPCSSVKNIVSYEVLRRAGIL